MPHPDLLLMATRLMRHLEHIMGENVFGRKSGGSRQGIDRKLARKIRQKKIAQGHAVDDLRTWYRHSDHWRSGRNDERRYDWEIYLLTEEQKSVPMQYRLRTSFAGSMRRWSVPGMNGAGNGTGV